MPGAAAANKRRFSWGIAGLHSTCGEIREAAAQCLRGFAHPARSLPGSERKELGSYLGKMPPFSTQKRWAAGGCLLWFGLFCCVLMEVVGIWERGVVAPCLLRRSQPPIGLLGGFVSWSPLLSLFRSLSLWGVSWLGGIWL